MKIKPYIQISIRTRAETIDWKIGEKLIDSLCASGDLLLPEKISHNADKISEDFLGKVESERYWAEKASISFNGTLSDFYQDFAWRRRKAIKSAGRIVHTKRNLRAQIVPGSINFRSEYSDRADWYEIFSLWCRIFPPQLGMLHVFTKPELGANLRNNSFQIGSFNAALRPEVPDIGWAMFYGDEFSSEVNAALVEDSGFAIERFDGGYLVRVTNNIQDVVDDFPLFESRRLELKNLFRKGLFLN
jgi:hypothetical protein